VGLIKFGIETRFLFVSFSTLQIYFIREDIGNREKEKPQRTQRTQRQQGICALCVLAGAILSDDIIAVAW